MIKNIFFDVDGTIYEEKTAKVKADTKVIEYISKQLNISYFKVYDEYKKIKRKIFKEIEDNPIRNDREKWYEGLLKELNCNTIEASFLSERYWQIIKENIELYEDFKLILPELEKNYNLYVVTDELLEIQKEKLKALNVMDKFKGIISSTDVGKVKPNKEIFEYALKVTNSRKEETLMIGDNPYRDIEGAKKVGLKTALIKRGRYYYYPIEKENEPDIIIKNYLELSNKIKAL